MINKAAHRIPLTSFVLLAGLAALFAPGGPTYAAALPQQAGEKTAPPAAEADKPATSLPSVARGGKLDRAALEEDLAKKLTGAVLRGAWQVTQKEGLEGKAALSPPKDDEYHIASARKLMGDAWIITARIKFADKDVTLPVPVRIVWAEDTAIITLSDVGLPVLGTYSARVMIFGNFYAGTWFGDCYGGVMSGQIVRYEPAGQQAPVPPAPAAERTPGQED